MTDNNKYIIIILSAIVINVGCHIAYDQFHIKGVWYIGNAVAWVLCSYPLYKLLPGIVTSILLAVTTQQLIDEIINDPTKAPQIEYVGFIILVIILYYNVYRNKRSNIKGNG